MVSVKKLKIFHLLLLGILAQENVFDDVLERKKAFLDHKNEEFTKWKNWDFCKRVSPWFRPKNWKFTISFVRAKIAQENVSDDILERKTVF